MKKGPGKRLATRSMMVGFSGPFHFCSIMAIRTEFLWHGSSLWSRYHIPRELITIRVAMPMTMVRTIAERRVNDFESIGHSGIAVT